MTNSPKPWLGEGGLLGPVEDGWPAPLDPYDVYAGISGDPVPVEYLLAHPAYDWRVVEQLANESRPHHAGDPSWLGTFGNEWGGPDIHEIERIREAFGQDVGVVSALRIHRMRAALS